MRKVRGGRIGLIFQEPMTALSVHYTVGNQIIEAIRAHSDLSKSAARERVVGLLHEVGIPRPETRIDAYPFQLSGGLRQRVGIALALAAEPQILIADEPTTALDVTTQAQILALLRRLQRTKGVALMLITHDMGVIAQMADDVAVMYLGRMVEFAPVAQLFSAPQHPYTRALLRSVPNLRAAPRERLATIGGAVPHPGARPVGCRWSRARQIQRDARTMRHSARYHHRASRLPGEAIDHAEAEPAAFADLLGGEERFERAARNFGRHAGAHVRHRDRHVITGDEAFVAVIEWLVEHGIRGRDRQAPATCHRIPRVDGQVEQRVLQLRRIDQAAPQHRVLRDFDLDGFAKRPLQDCRQPADQLVHVGDLRPQRLLAGESEQAAVEIGDPLGRLDRPFGQAAARDVGGRQCVEQQIEIAERRRQHVVGVVRDPSG